MLPIHTPCPHTPHLTQNYTHPHLNPHTTYKTQGGAGAGGLPPGAIGPPEQGQVQQQQQGGGAAGGMGGAQGQQMMDPNAQAGAGMQGESGANAGCLLCAVAFMYACKLEA